MLAFLATVVLEMRGIDLADALGLHFCLADSFSPLQFVSYMFLHANFQHIFFNMFALWMFGCVIEHTWGARHFLLYYMVCGLGAGVMQELAQLVQYYFIVADMMPGASLSDLLRLSAEPGIQAGLSQWTTIGASGAVYGILLAFGMTFPENRIYIFPLPVPIKAKWFVLIYVALELVMALSSRGDGVAHTAHLGGMLFGWLLIRYWRRRAGFRPYREGGGVLTNLRRRLQRRAMGITPGGQADTQPESDWDYSNRRRANQSEVDRILDKVIKSGYDSLTEDEKKELFKR